MKITKVEVVEPDEENPGHYYWALIHTDEGITGVGETYHGMRGAARAVIEAFSGVLVGQNPLDTDFLWAKMFHATSYHGQQGAEFRAISAIDVALWDIKGKYFGVPVYVLLGGKCRDSVPIYYSGGLDGIPVNEQAYACQAAKMVAEGWKAFKTDTHSEYKRFPDQYISAEDVERGAEKLRWVREAVGKRLEICIDCHASWDTASAVRVAKALEEFDILFIEEPVGPDNYSALAEVAASTRVPICTGERLFGRSRFRELLERHICDIIMPDLAWTGGISEMKKIATMAETYYVPIAPHNYGPVTCMALVHIMSNVPNTRYLEFTANHYVTWNEWIDKPIVPKDSHLELPTEPGLGVQLSQEVMERHTRRTR